MTSCRWSVVGQLSAIAIIDRIRIDFRHRPLPAVRRSRPVPVTNMAFHSAECPVSAEQLVSPDPAKPVGRSQLYFFRDLEVKPCIQGFRMDLPLPFSATMNSSHRTPSVLLGFQWE